MTRGLSHTEGMDGQAGRTNEPLGREGLRQADPEPRDPGPDLAGWKSHVEPGCRDRAGILSF